MTGGLDISGQECAKWKCEYSPALVIRKPFLPFDYKGFFGLAVNVLKSSGDFDLGSV